MGYGEHPYLTWAREPPVARLAYWSKAAGPARITIRDENGSVWRELPSPSSAGLNVVEYDLTADPAKADAAEAVAREKARAREAREKAAEPPSIDAEEPEDEEEVAEEKPDEKPTAPAKVKPVTDPELARLLADPLRATRKRFLPPGKYRVEIAAGGVVEKTSLTIKARKEEEADE